jgi:hypothetical protein
MCSWPKQSVDPAKKKHWQYMYFNECMSGFEWQAAAHMVYEGIDRPDLLEHGLAVARAIHDRYDASLRNPYNEIECGDHYARAMASYGLFQAVCGFQCHGPRGEIEFAPRLSPKVFRAPMIAPEGWGTFSQSAADDAFHAELDVKHGAVPVARLTLTLPEGFSAESISAQLSGENVAAQILPADTPPGEPDRGNRRITIALPEDTIPRAGEKLKIDLT